MQNDDTQQNEDPTSQNQPITHPEIEPAATTGSGNTYHDSQPNLVTQPSPVTTGVDNQGGNTDSHSSPGLVVLQWLTYAFWGWTLIAFSTLIGAIVSSLIISDVDAGQVVIYSLAGVVVLLPAAFFCDRYYVKKEPVKKSGAAMAVMIIHAVIFALIAVGSLITAVFTAVSMVVSNGESETKIVIILTSIIIALFYAITFVRTLNPVKFSTFSKKYRWVMLISAVIIGIGGIVGPVAKEYARKDDRLIEQNISSLSSSINSYTNDKKELPDSLKDLDLDGEVETLVNKNLVEYKKETEAGGFKFNNTYSGTRSTYSYTKTFKYQLCVNYKYEDSSSPGYYNYGNDLDGYTTYARTYGHDKGEVCYKLKTEVRSSTPASPTQDVCDYNTTNCSGASE